MTNSREKVRALRQWLLDAFGNGVTTECQECGAILDISSMTVDHYPIPACAGGLRERGNVRPLCGPCNHGHKGQMRKRDALRLKNAALERKRAGIDRRNERFAEPMTYQLGADVGWVP